MNWIELGRFYGIESVNSSEEFKSKVCEKFQITEPFLFSIYDIIDITKNRVGLKMNDEVLDLVSTVELINTKPKSKYLDVKGNKSVLRLLGQIASEVNYITNKDSRISFHYNKKDFVISFKGKPFVRFEKIDRYEYQFLYGDLALQGIGQDIIEQLKSGSKFNKLKTKWITKRVTDKFLIQIIKEFNDIKFFKTK